MERKKYVKLTRTEALKKLVKEKKLMIKSLGLKKIKFKFNSKCEKIDVIF